MSKSCTFCNSPEGLGSSGSRYAELKGLELISKTLEIPLEKDAEVYSFCTNCSSCLRQIYEFELEIEVLQLKIGDKIKDIQITILENPSKSSKLGLLFITKCKSFRQNPVVVLTSNVSSYVTKNKKEKNWNFKLKEVDKTKKNDDEGDEVHYEIMDVDNVGIKQEEEDGEQFGIEPEEIDTIDTEDRLSDCSYHPDPEDVDEAEINDDDGDGEISGGIKCEVVLLESEGKTSRSKIQANSNQTETKVSHSCECPYCDKSFGSSQALSVHLKFKHRDVFKFTAKPKTRQRLSTDDKSNSTAPCKCQYCDKTFRNTSGLNCHIKFRHKQIKIINCSQCNRTFINKGRLTSHLQKEHNAPISENTKYCNICGKMFSRRANLLAHIKTVHEEAKDFHCNQCHTPFRYRSTLLSHLKKDHDGKEVLDPEEEEQQPQPMENEETDNEDKTVKRASLRKRPPPKYDSNKTYPFECERCDPVRKFTTQGNLNLHIKYIHEPTTTPYQTGKRSLDCETCGVKFKKRANLLNHIKTVHEKLKRFTCKHCNREFRYRTTYQEHLTKKHSDVENESVYKRPTPGPVVCHLCGKTLLSAKTLPAHLRTHTKERPFKCDECDKTFTNKFYFRSHKVSSHGAEGNWKCPHCSRWFYIKRNYDNHLASHAGIKSTVCDRCGKALAGPCSLKKHMRFHDKLDRKNQNQQSSKTNIPSPSQGQSESSQDFINFDTSNFL